MLLRRVPILIFLSSLLFVPLISKATYFTGPLNPLPSIGSYFDHTNPGYTSTFSPITDGVIKIYNGTTAVQANGICSPASTPYIEYYGSGPNAFTCYSYDGHNGIDYPVTAGTAVFAPADGTVIDVNSDSCNGNYVKIWHPAIGNQGLLTLYDHLSIPFIVQQNQSIARFQQIGLSGATGQQCVNGAHLHFGVSDAQVGGNRIDPYGWPTGTTTPDPWPYDQGYLWTTNPPSLNVNPATYVSGTISQNTIWTTQGSPYVIQGNATLSASTTLTINPGVVVKFENNSSFYIYGNLTSLGGTSSTTRVYFTSIKDDTLVGDTNNDGATTTPAAGDYMGLYFYPGSTANLTRTTFRHGGNDYYPYHFGVIKNLGGTVTLVNANIEHGQNGIINISGSLSLTNNTINTDTGLYNFQQIGGISTINSNQFIGTTTTNQNLFLNNGTSTLIGNIFSNANLNAVYVNASVSLVNSHNVSIGNGRHGMEFAGTLDHDQVWVPDLAYVVQYLNVLPQKTLTIDPGVIVKMPYGGRMDIFGNLISVGGASTSTQISFTSMSDDSIGGDTNGDATATSPVAGDYYGVYVQSGGNATIANTTFRYGGGHYSLYQQYYGAIKNLGGTVTVNNVNFQRGLAGMAQIGGLTTISNSIISPDGGSYGFLQIWGNSIITGNQFVGTSSIPYNIYFQNGTTTFSDNTFSDTSQGDVYIDANSIFTQSNNKSGTTGGHGIVLSGFLNHDQTLTSGIPYVIGYLSVFPQNTLTINPGVVVKFPYGGQMSVLGNLIALGGISTSTKIYFTSISDDVIGGDTNGNGNATLPTAGDYYGIFIQPNATATILNSTIRYGGGGNWSVSSGVVKNLGGAITLASTKIEKSLEGVIQVGGSTTILNSFIAPDIGSHGFFQAWGESNITGNQFIGTSSTFYNINFQNGTTTFSGNTFTNANNGDVSINANANFTQAGNISLGAGAHGIVFGGILTHDQVLASGTPYVISFLNIQPQKKLTANPGVILKFSAYSYLDVFGDLRLEGQKSTTTKVYLTSIQNDAVGGDTNGDGNATTPAPGDYGGILFEPGSTGEIKNTQIEYGGYGGYPLVATLKNNGGRISITNTKFANNSNGIILNGGTTTISQSSLIGLPSNSPFFYNNFTATTTAQNNWWGSASGPNHPNLNPTGTGSSVLGNVLFAPWLLSDPN